MKIPTAWQWVLACVCMCLATTAVAADRVLVTPELENGVVRFVPATNNTLVLTISGPEGVYLQQSYKPGETPTFSATNRPEGLYRYEVREQPAVSDETLAVMRAARESGDTSVITRLIEAGKLPRESAMQSGTFRLSLGGFVNQDALEQAVAKDVLHYDDVIITGSLCVGFDCVNGESFGYCTVKLKENNLQLCFEDTSAGSFPTNDWKIQINDTTSGGASYFTIWDTDGGRRVFTLEAGAPAHSLYVEDYGRVGLGTSIPYVELHIKDGDSPTIRLDQDGSSGWTAQSWDLCGNETNFFIRDVTNGSKLCFRIQPNTPSSTLCLRSTGTGYVGVGTWSPDAKLDIEDSGPVIRLTNTGSGGGIWDWKVNANTGRMNITDDSSATRVPIKFDPGADNNLFRVGVYADDAVDVNGRFFINGTQVTPDFVFEPDYELETIEEHAEVMWSRKHLPALAPADPEAQGRFDVGSRSQGMLEELEKAHIYIEQLHARLQALEAALQELQSQND